MSKFRVGDHVKVEFETEVSRLNYRNEPIIISPSGQAICLPNKHLTLIKPKLSVGQTWEDNSGDKYTIRIIEKGSVCLLYTSPSPRDGLLSRMPSSA